MPERAAIVTALITERPLCLACISVRSTMTTPEAEAILQTIEHVLTLRRIDHGRCRACGTVGSVFSVDQPPT